MATWHTTEHLVDPYPNGYVEIRLRLYSWDALNRHLLDAEARETFLRTARPLLDAVPETRTAAELRRQGQSLELELAKADNAVAQAQLQIEAAHLDGLTGEKLAKKLLAAESARKAAEAKAAEYRQALELIGDRVAAAETARNNKLKAIGRDAGIQGDKDLQSQIQNLYAAIAALIKDHVTKLVLLNEQFVYMRSESWRDGCIKEALGPDADGSDLAVTSSPAAPPGSPIPFAGVQGK